MTHKINVHYGITDHIHITPLPPWALKALQRGFSDSSDMGIVSSILSIFNNFNIFFFFQNCSFIFFEFLSFWNIPFLISHIKRGCQVMFFNTHVFILPYLDYDNNVIMMLFVDFESIFIPLIPYLLIYNIAYVFCSLEQHYTVLDLSSLSCKDRGLQNRTQTPPRN